MYFRELVCTAKQSRLHVRQMSQAEIIVYGHNSVNSLCYVFAASLGKGLQSDAQQELVLGLFFQRRIAQLSQFGSDFQLNLLCCHKQDVQHGLDRKFLHPCLSAIKVDQALHDLQNAQLIVRNNARSDKGQKTEQLSEHVISLLKPLESASNL